jgi:hypothetical protein
MSTTIARYKELEGHPFFQYNVELIVLSNGKRIKIAEINCKDDKDLAQATAWCEFVLKGDDLRPSSGDELIDVKGE